MIRLEDVTKRYRNGRQVVEALGRLTEQVLPGEFVVISGRSGAGKSTFLSVVGGLIRPDAGRVLVAGRDLWAMGDRERSRLRSETMGFVFQFASLIPTLTVLENVLLPTAFMPRSQGTRQRGLDLLEQVGLAEMQHRLPWQLSGGQQKRVAVARALLNRPPLLLADEPTGDLDPETERDIVALFTAAHRQGTTVLLVTHNRELAAQGTRHLVLSGGQVACAS